MAEKLTPSKEGHNSGATKGTFLTYLRRASGAKTAQEEAASAYSLVLKDAKANGVNIKQLKAVIAARKLDPEEVARDTRDFERYMRWMGMPVGAQGALFETPEPDSTTTEPEDREHTLWLAEDAGFKAGRAGQARGDNPEEVGSETHQAWDREWLRGQRRIASEMGPGIEKVGPPKKGKGVPKPGKKGEVVQLREQQPTEPEPTADAPEEAPPSGKVVH